MSRVTEIRYVGYGVADFDAEAAFYTDVWGLERVQSDDGLAWFKASGHDEPHIACLRPADANRLDLIAFATDSRADVDALAMKVADAGAGSCTPRAN